VKTFAVYVERRRHDRAALYIEADSPDQALRLATKRLFDNSMRHCDALADEGIPWAPPNETVDITGLDDVTEEVERDRRENALLLEGK
jgi:hypothetical protein